MRTARSRSARPAKLATKVGAAQNYYKPREAVKLARDHGLYLIGRVVVFEDPVLSAKRPGPRDPARRRRRLDDLRRSRLDESLRRAGLEVQRRHRRGRRARRASTRSCSTTSASRATATSRRSSSTTQVKEPKGDDDGPLRELRTRPAAPARRARLGGGVRPCGDARSRHRPEAHGSSRRYLDAIYPMVYPSHYGPGEYDSPTRTRIPAGRSRSRSGTSARSSGAARRSSSPGSRTSRSSARTRWPRSRPRSTPPGAATRPASCSGTRRASIRDGALAAQLALHASTGLCTGAARPVETVEK